MAPDERDMWWTVMKSSVLHFKVSDESACLSVTCSVRVAGRGKGMGRWVSGLGGLSFPRLSPAWKRSVFPPLSPSARAAGPRSGNKTG